MRRTYKQHNRYVTRPLTSTIGEACPDVFDEIYASLLEEASETALAEIAPNGKLGGHIEQERGTKTQETMIVHEQTRLARFVMLKELSGGDCRHVRDLGHNQYEALIVPVPGKEHSKVLIESPRVGNAIYMFETDDWHTAIYKTKPELRRRGAERIIHNLANTAIDERCLDFLTTPDKAGK